MANSTSKVVREQGRRPGLLLLGVAGWLSITCDLHRARVGMRGGRRGSVSTEGEEVGSGIVLHVDLQSPAHASCGPSPPVNGSSNHPERPLDGQLYVGTPAVRALPAAAE